MNKEKWIIGKVSNPETYYAWLKFFESENKDE